MIKEARRSGAVGFRKVVREICSVENDALAIVGSFESDIEDVVSALPAFGREHEHAEAGVARILKSLVEPHLALPTLQVLTAVENGGAGRPNLVALVRKSLLG